MRKVGNKRKESYKKALRVLLVFTFLCWSAMLYRSVDLFSRGELALANKNGTAAITNFEHSALLYAPFNLSATKALYVIKNIADNSDDTYLKRQAKNSLIRISRQLYPANISSFNDTGKTPNGIPLLRRVAIHFFFFSWMAGAIYIFFRGFTINGIIIAPELIKGVTLFSSSLLIWLFLLSV